MCLLIVKLKFDELKSKLDKEKQTFTKALVRSSKEVCIFRVNRPNRLYLRDVLKNEIAKFQELNEKFGKEKASHLQVLKDAVSKYEEEKERLFLQYEQLTRLSVTQTNSRKKEKSLISECEKTCSSKISDLEGSLKKKKQDDKCHQTFSFLKKTLSSFIESPSDEDIASED
ncbi:DNA metabolism protein [Lithospermum erythrorhizon]|uniref:DNA metabolism protein n=1 Tax=Lithospermum erythrorhizon TaxID=34254 RepID=A0AAV3QZ66_LITER